MLPHRRQPTRLPRPWDSPGKNTGVGCRFLLQCIKVKSESEVAQSCLTLSDRDPMDCSLLHPWDFPGKSTGVGCHCLLPKSLQSCPTLCDPMGYSLPGSSVREIFPKQEYWSGLPLSPPEDLPDPGIEPNPLMFLPWHVCSLPLSD